MLKKTHLALAIVSSIALSGTAFAADMVSPPNSLVVADTGNVGVGTAEPKFPLHIVGLGVGEQRVLRLEAINGSAQLSFNTVDRGNWLFGMSSQGNFKITSGGTGILQAVFYKNGDLKLGGVLIEGSDRNIKQDIVPVDSVSVLEAVAKLPISTWEYKGQDGVKHLGPMAQDFHTAFGLGNTPKGIASIDTGGVALAAIQGLNEIVQTKDKEIASLKAENEELSERLTMLENIVNKLTAKEVVMNQ